MGKLTSSSVPFSSSYCIFRFLWRSIHAMTSNRFAHASSYCFVVYFKVARFDEDTLDRMEYEVDKTKLTNSTPQKKLFFSFK
jgi:hypothetical protein